MSQNLKIGYMKVREGQSQPHIGAAAFVALYIGLGGPFKYQVLTVTQAGSRAGRQNLVEILSKLMVI